MKKQGYRSRQRVLIGAAGLLLLAVPAVFAAGKPGDFKLATTSPVTVSGDRVQQVVAAKLDDEPGTDLALVNSFNSIAVLSGNGDGDFDQIEDEPVPDAPKQVAVADLDGENGKDLAITTQDSTVEIFLNDGTGDFEEAASSPEPVAYASGITAANVGGDQDIDLVVGNLGDPLAQVLLNDGNGDFAPGDSFPFAIVEALENADLDGDGDRDLVGLSFSPDGGVVSLNDGKGNFSDGVPLPQLESDAYGLAVGRIDGGRSPDIAIGALFGVHIYLNDGDGGFTPSPHSPLGSGRLFNEPAIADFDGDGRGDVAAGEVVVDEDHPDCTNPPFSCPSTRAVAVFLGRPNGSFKEPGTSPEAAGDSGNGAPYLAAGKFDRRKGLDIAAANSHGGSLEILLNRSP